MSSVADDVLARIQAEERRTFQSGGGRVVVTRDELAAFGAKYMDGVKLDDIREFGVVRIVRQDEGDTSAAPPVKPVNPKDDLVRHQFACQIARRRGEPEPPAPVIQAPVKGAASEKLPGARPVRARGKASRPAQRARPSRNPARAAKR